MVRNKYNIFIFLIVNLVNSVKINNKEQNLKICENIKNKNKSLNCINNYDSYNKNKIYPPSFKNKEKDNNNNSFFPLYSELPDYFFKENNNNFEDLIFEVSSFYFIFLQFYFIE